MILLIDNYDSFTFNLSQLIQELGLEVLVVRNDVMSVTELALLRPSHLIISPGPGRPEDAGISLEAIRFFTGKIPILGVCLGHQAIALTFGGQVVLAPSAFHGKCSHIEHDGQGLFQNIPLKTKVARYHSLMVTSLPECLRVTSQTEDGVVMGIEHKEFPVIGVQFHPESFATENGKQMLSNFLGKAS
jgi:anthranilate synthase/aminodeoxychorismate synthase-like glutamine amidotransferase